MNLWESWYLNYTESETIDEDLLAELTLWGARFVQNFSLGGYARNQSPFTLLPHEAMSVLSFLYRDGVDIERILDMAEEYTEGGSIRIPVQWLAEPKEMAYIHTTWTHNLLHGHETEGFWMTPHLDIETLPTERQICLLLDSVEFILEIANFLEETDRIRIDTWAKLLYGEKMMLLSSNLLDQSSLSVPGQPPKKATRTRIRTLKTALVSFCRADYLDFGDHLVYGRPVTEKQAKLLSTKLNLISSLEFKIVQLVDTLYRNSEGSLVSTTCLSTPDYWLEQALDTASAILYLASDAGSLSGDILHELSSVIERAAAYARLDAILSEEDRVAILRWESNLFDGDNS
ncbi:MAG: hypothetical protein JXA42_03295 [Anaerolineales bacterium]|nr:hypothetical protein [Anaerolineales bacterium]